MSSAQASAGIDKARHPERYCPQPRCLWRTTDRDGNPTPESNGGWCPRHVPRNTEPPQDIILIDNSPFDLKGAR